MSGPVDRRRWLVAGVAAVAAAGGVGWEAWQRRRREQEEAAAAGLWGLSFERPEGGELVMDALRGRPTVLNFWATWCPPCLREMPALDRFHRDFASRGWQVVGLAIDGPTPVRDFLRRMPVGFPIGLAGLAGTDLVRRLGNEAGGLPFTVIFGADGRPLHRKMGETDYEQLVAWAQTVR